jgi:hypothetical protein
MEPLNDNELEQLLQEWHALDAPPRLEGKLFPKQPWWRWLLTGSIRIPVPVGLAALAVFGFLLYGLRQPAPAAGSVSLADFQPIENTTPQIVRSSYEGQ